MHETLKPMELMALITPFTDDVRVTHTDLLFGIYPCITFVSFLTINFVSGILCLYNISGITYRMVLQFSSVTAIDIKFPECNAPHIITKELLTEYYILSQVETKLLRNSQSFL